MTIRETVPTKEKGQARSFIILGGANLTYSGSIIGFKPGETCEFPNNSTDCIFSNGVGINLNGFVSNFGNASIPVKMDKITITTGKCLVYVE